MRFASNGIDSGPIFAIRGSFITLALTRSRWARDLKTIQAKTIVSLGFVLANLRKRDAELGLQVVADAFFVIERAVLTPNLAGFRGNAAVGGDALLGDGNHIAIDVGAW